VCVGADIDLRQLFCCDNSCIGGGGGGSGDTLAETLVGSHSRLSVCAVCNCDKRLTVHFAAPVIV
jgi:hypothetical protein